VYVFINVLSGKGVEKDEHRAMEWFKYVAYFYTVPHRMFLSYTYIKINSCA